MNERKWASKSCQIAARIPKIPLIRPFFGGTKFNATKSTRYHNYSVLMFLHSKIITVFDWTAAKVSLHTGDGLLAFNAKGCFHSKRKGTKSFGTQNTSCRNRSVVWLTAKETNRWHWISMLVECKMSRKKTKRTVLIHLCHLNGKLLSNVHTLQFFTGSLSLFQTSGWTVSNYSITVLRSNYFSPLTKKNRLLFHILTATHIIRLRAKRTPMNTVLSCPHSAGNSTYSFLCRGWSLLFLHCDMSRLRFPFTQNTPE